MVPPCHDDHPRISCHSTYFSLSGRGPVLSCGSGDRQRSDRSCEQNRWNCQFFRLRQQWQWSKCRRDLHHAGHINHPVNPNLDSLVHSDGMRSGQFMQRTLPLSARRAQWSNMLKRWSDSLSHASTTTSNLLQRMKTRLTQKYLRISSPAYSWWVIFTVIDYRYRFSILFSVSILATDWFNELVIFSELSERCDEERCNEKSVTRGCQVSPQREQRAVEEHGLLLVVGCHRQCRLIVATYPTDNRLHNIR